ncbi:MAG: bifunctional diaminohydroxyphosphoribosylaminopyrimidine deaminase/5-amino-6-(5-phosphoribosylamino)uracil reductase RibD [Bryobacterales bacterium]|nr:bifunctional diaminohydroxyphosphoribosylaminopyrimidine deaminase/5-amino-6-(5-phosphoribosylamino)uracil reductase RibD [Bryobacterales bacterium]
MQAALDEARKGLGLASPNPMVGAVLVRDNQIVGRGYHIYANRKHAEIVALEEAGGLARGATLYISLEPCCHHGRTPPCTDALIAAGVAKVVSAIPDPNLEVSGQGFEQLRAAGIEVEMDATAARAAEELNAPFLHFMRTGRPLVTLKAALTLDGKIAAPEDNRGWITSEKARLHVQTLRHSSDAILTGIGTVLSDDPLLNDRTALPRSRPLLRIVLDSQLRIPPHARMVETCREDVLVVTTSLASAERRRALEDAGVRVLVADHPSGRTDMRQVVESLARENYLSLMIEGGSRVNWAALECGVVDKIFFYYAPKILGGLQSLPVAGGTGKLRRSDAILFRDVHLHPITSDEFAVEAYLVK